MTVVIHQGIGIECSVRSLQARAIVRPHYWVITDVCFATVASSHWNCNKETIVVTNQLV